MSHSVRLGHITPLPKWWLIVKKLRPILDGADFKLEPSEYGWTDTDGHLVPQKHLLVPEGLKRTCGCKSKDKETRCRWRILEKDGSQMYVFLWVQKCMCKCELRIDYGLGDSTNCIRLYSLFQDLKQNEANSIITDASRSLLSNVKFPNTPLYVQGWDITSMT